MSLVIRPALPAEDEIVARHYRALWDSYGTPPDHYRADAIEQVLAFLDVGREQHELAVFFAVDGDAIVGSAGCQLHTSPFPEVIKPEHRRFGYIWSVYVEPTHQRKGIAKQLVSHAIEHLRGLGCTIVSLNSSVAGRQLYRSLGFEDATEMRLSLT
jgi:ribosomal protein S18 acetylase RimI-like enzyme